MYEIVATTFMKTIGWFADTHTEIDTVDNNPSGYIRDIYDSAIMEGASASISKDSARFVMHEGSRRTIIGFNPFA